LLTLCLFGAVRVATAAEFYVSPTAAANGNGSFNNPWKLQTALDHPAAVQPGDTIWLRGGIYNAPPYTSRLVGTSADPIIVRQYPGERARIDGNYNGNANTLTINGKYTWFWGFEIFNSDPTRFTSDGGNPPRRGTGAQLSGDGTRMINMIVHDTSQGVSVSEAAEDGRVYGTLFYYNGYDSPDRGHGHGIYSQNLGTIWKKIYDNFLFDQFGWGIHAYAEGGHLDNFDFQGNISFNNGSLSGGYHANILVGGLRVATNPKLISNYTYNFDQQNRNDLGGASGCTSPTVQNNYFVGGQALDVNNCSSMTITGNTFVGTISGFSQSAFPSNTYYGTSRPTGIKVFVRPNTYEAGRANIVVYNWDLAATVSVDVSAILSPGDGFEVRNAADFFGAPVLTGTYGGGSITLPMDNLTVATPVGVPAPPPTGPEFNAFVLLPASPGGTPTPTPIATSTPTATRTATGTATRTPTSLPPTATATRTATSVPPTATWTATATRTPTRTATAVPPTATRTPTNPPPTATATRTPTDPPDTPTPTRTATGLPPTATRTPTDPPNTPTPTRTPTRTATGVPPTATRTPTDPPDTPTPTRTPTRTATGVPPTATRTPTDPPDTPTPTRTATSVPPSATATPTNPPPTATRTPTRTPTFVPATPTPTPEEELFRVEAEAAALTGTMAVMPGTQAYGGWYIASATANSGSATWHFNIPVPGSYVVWCRVHAIDNDHDAFDVRADEGPWDTYDVAQGTWGPNWQWTRVNGRGGTTVPLTINPRVFQFTAGDHSLRFRGKRPLTRADRVIITNDFDFVPTEGNTNSFWDVTPANPFYDFIESLARNEVTQGCGSENFCPEEFIKRSQMAVMILKAKHGSDYTPPAATGTVFTDVPANAFAAAWIEQLAEEGITSGCGNGKYCPNRSVTRKEMAVFLVKATHNPGYVPPPAVGMFGDVSPAHPFARWIEQLALQGVTAGCGNGNFCPTRPNTREQMAAFLVKAFDLP
jgi:hypothetical protein